jgi:hypothetical protein
MGAIQAAETRPPSPRPDLGDAAGDPGPQSSGLVARPEPRQLSTEPRRVASALVVPQDRFDRIAILRSCGTGTLYRVQSASATRAQDRVQSRGHSRRPERPDSGPGPSSEFWSACTCHTTRAGATRQGIENVTRTWRGPPPGGEAHLQDALQASESRPTSPRLSWAIEP